MKRRIAREGERERRGVAGEREGKGRGRGGEEGETNSDDRMQLPVWQTIVTSSVVGTVSEACVLQQQWKN